MKKVLGKNDKGILVDRSDEDHSRLQFVALNNDCPQSTIKAVDVQAIRNAKDEPFIAGMSLILGTLDTLEAINSKVQSINRALKGTGLRISADHIQLAELNEPSVDFLLPFVKNEMDAAAHFTVFTEKALALTPDVLAKNIATLFQKGLIGKNIKEAGSKFATLMKNDMMVNARKLIELSPGTDLKTAKAQIAKDMSAKKGTAI